LCLRAAKFVATCSNWCQFRSRTNLELDVPLRRNEALLVVTFQVATHLVTSGATPSPAPLLCAKLLQTWTLFQAEPLPPSSIIHLDGRKYFGAVASTSSSFANFEHHTFLSYGAALPCGSSVSFREEHSCKCRVSHCPSNPGSSATSPVPLIPAQMDQNRVPAEQTGREVDVRFPFQISQACS
jgi:hypothetical protein